MQEQLPTARELEALKILWRSGRATVRDVYDQMRTGERDLAYTTVLSLMQTMEKKGLVGRESAGRGKTHVYFGKVEPDSTLRSLAAQFLDTVFDGAVNQYLVSALESKRPTEEELRELELMIQDAKRKVQRR